MSTKIFSILLFLGGFLGVGMFGYSLYQQTQVQSQMNASMSVINDSIISTRVVIRETSTVLDPLTETTTALAQIEQREQATVQHLASMNAHLRTTADSETQIITGLDNLNSYVTHAGSSLQKLADTNHTLLQTGRTSLYSAQQEGGQVGQLNTLTTQTITQLRTLNGKLAPLRLLP
ncbi:hypothetical protein JJB07_01385 [Tumebacillus sp. ITR2]|uniref:Methyl-accepting chemotaxis protein n=1 Tax=Tumebacillus amylolyticus TaxID=2801339 RepID=A0ABS1J4T6_9BACL|nr:hypothetical protein [Tumebacillus amylolyticus]MBL0385285.1 hypothetical protein [Tumebacillus amylolyticus]